MGDDHITSNGWTSSLTVIICARLRAFPNLQILQWVWVSTFLMQNCNIGPNFCFSRIIGATSIIFSYLGEFVSISNRDITLCRLEVFWNIGIILLPGKTENISPSVYINLGYCS